MSDAADEQAGSVAGVEARLVVESGFYAGLEWPLETNPTVVGRGRDADLVLSEGTMSRAHALLGYEDGRVFVQDLGSTNGTMVNGNRETRAFLSDGDELQLGKLVLKISLPDSSVRGGARGS